MIGYNSLIHSFFDHTTLLFLSLFSSILLFFIFKVWHVRHHPSKLPTNWPLTGMAPALLTNFHRILLWLTSIQLETNGSYMIRGPWFMKMEIFCTSDSANFEYILSKRHNDFHRGSNFNRIFDMWGEGIFSVDGSQWKYQRKVAHSVFTNTCFRKLLTNTVKDKLNNGLIPFLNRACEQGLTVDLEDLFRRFTCDVTFITIMGHDPASILFQDLSDINPISNFVHNVETTILWRHHLPEGVSKLQRWLELGSEKSMKESMEAAEAIFYDCIAKRREEVEKHIHTSLSAAAGTDHDHDDPHHGKDLLTLYIMENYGKPENGFQSTTKFLRDTLTTLISAGQNTTSVALAWFFWLLSKYPEVETKIRQELQDKVFFASTTTNFSKEEEEVVIYNKLVYLHATICESLRLYPPVPFNHRASREPVILPSGHKVNPWTMIILNNYAAGRMRSIWGEDCMEFKPERWITNQGTIKHVSSHKFPSFGSGPRVCLGKEIALNQMKAAITAIIRHNFHFQVIEGQRIEPGFSITLTMKHGLKVKVMKGNPIHH